MYKTRAPKYNWKATKSHGIILIRPPKYKDSISSFEFLMVCRRNTFSYVDYILGKYKENESEYISHLIVNMTYIERSNIKKNKYSLLWNNLYAYSREPEGEFYSQVEKKFNRNLSKFLTLDANLPCFWNNPEWGFPKGRKNENETSIECAKRELQEETGIYENMYYMDTTIDPFVEEFIGTNGLKYINIFYVAFVNSSCQEFLDEKNKYQIREVSQIQWLSTKKANSQIRYHEHSKQYLIKKLTKMLQNNKYLK